MSIRFVCLNDLNALLVLLCLVVDLYGMLVDEMSRASDTVILPKAWQIFIECLMQQFFSVLWQHVF